MAAKPKVILPEEGKRNILITSALPYVNNVPHLGNIIGSVLSADCYARYSKLRDRPTLFICGTDEYGTASETKALELGITPRQLCDEFAAKHKAIYDWFELGFDFFGRTSTEKHTQIVQDIFRKLERNGYLLKKKAARPYCNKHQGFLADRFIEGTCPRCGYEDARGDQCDRCGNTFDDPFELINPHCKIDVDETPVSRDTTHMFLQLDKLQPDVEKWFEKSSAAGWSENGVAITRSWLDQGLKERSITRDLSWGVPVPSTDPELSSKVIYVWFDACIGYPSITANYTDEWERWWKTPDHVSLYQFMGKDNVPFHSVVFPASEIGTGEKWSLVNNISTTEYLNYETGKFSKSRGIGVFGDTAKLTGVPPSVWRYYLLANRPEVSDTEFKWKEFVAANNNELLANFGNFINRVVKFTVANFESTIPHFDPDYDEPATTENTLDFRVWLADVQTLLSEYNEELEGVHLRAGTEKLMAISSKGNLLLQKRVDNANLAAHPERTTTVVGLALNLCSLLASLCAPYMPSTATSIAQQLGSTLQFIPDKWDPTFLKPGHKIGKPAYLFTNIDEKMVEEWKEKYGGTQADREKLAEEARLKLEKKEMEKERRKAKQDAARAEAEKNGVVKKEAEEKEEKPAKPLTEEERIKQEKRKQERDRKKAIKDAAKAKKAGEKKAEGGDGKAITAATEDRDALPVRQKDEPVEK